MAKKNLTRAGITIPLPFQKDYIAKQARNYERETGRSYTTGKELPIRSVSKAFNVNDYDSPRASIGKGSLIRQVSGLTFDLRQRRRSREAAYQAREATASLQFRKQSNAIAAKKYRAKKR